MAKINLGRVVGKDNYELAVQQGYVGTLDEWLESLKGKDGAPGTTDYNELDNKPDLSVYQTKYEAKKSFDVNMLSASAGVATYALVLNQATNILNALPSGVNSTITIPSPVAGKENESVVHFSTGATAPTIVYSGFTPIWLNSMALAMKINKKYTIVFEQVRTATGTWIVKASWGEY